MGFETGRRPTLYTAQPLGLAQLLLEYIIIMIIVIMIMIIITLYCEVQYFCFKEVYYNVISCMLPIPRSFFSVIRIACHSGPTFARIVQMTEGLLYIR